MAEKTRVQVEIFGQQYTLRVEGDEQPEYVESLASHVERKMREIAEATPTVDSLKLAILAALNVTDEYFRLKLESDRIDDIIAERTKGIVSRIEEAVEEAEKS
jgi:cell division protein ZapA